MLDKKIKTHIQNRGGPLEGQQPGDVVRHGSQSKRRGDRFPEEGRKRGRKFTSSLGAFARKAYIPRCSAMAGVAGKVSLEWQWQGPQ